MKTILINISIVIFIFFSCEAQNTNITAMPMAATTSENENQYVLSNNQFAFKIFNAMKCEDSNLFITTFGLYNSLFPLYFGAASKTKDEISNLLNIPLSDTSIISDYSKIDSTLNKYQNKYTFKYANSIWCDNSFTIKSSYETSFLNKTDIDLFPINFYDSSNACNKINNWIYENTNGHINKIVEEQNLKPNTSMLLVNSILLDTEWARNFDEALTQENTFYNYKDKSSKVLFLNQLNNFNYYENSQFKILELKYIGNDFSLFIVLPFSFKNLQNDISQLYDIINSPENFLTTQYVNVSIPKFRVDNNISFVPYLKEIGAESLFSISCDLSNLFTKNNSIISDVFQSNIFEINETRTLFVSATITHTISTSNDFSIDDVKSFKANHPFYYILKNNETGLIISIGQTIKLN